MIHPDLAILRFWSEWSFAKMAPRAKPRTCRRNPSRWDILGTSILPNQVDSHKEKSGKMNLCVFWQVSFKTKQPFDVFVAPSFRFCLAQEAILQRLCTLHAHQGVGPAGVRDILAAHCKSIEGSGGADVATAEMEGLTMCALKSLPDACFSWLCGGALKVLIRGA